MSSENKWESESEDESGASDISAPLDSSVLGPAQPKDRRPPDRAGPSSKAHGSGQPSQGDESDSEGSGEDEDRDSPNASLADPTSNVSLAEASDQSMEGSEADKTLAGLGGDKTLGDSDDDKSMEGSEADKSLGDGGQDSFGSSHSASSAAEEKGDSDLDDSSSPALKADDSDMDESSPALRAEESDSDESSPDLKAEESELDESRASLTAEEEVKAEQPSQVFEEPPQDEAGSPNASFVVSSEKLACAECPYETGHELKLKAHQLRHRLPLAKCSRCSMSLRGLRQRQMHRLRCLRTFPQSVLQSSQLKPRPSTFSQRVFPGAASSELSACPHCPARARRPASIQLHVAKWHRDQLPKAPEHQVDVKTEEQKPVGKSFPCGNCPYVASATRDLKRHQASKTACEYRRAHGYVRTRPQRAKKPITVVKEETEDGIKIETKVDTSQTLLSCPKCSYTTTKSYVLVRHLSSQIACKLRNDRSQNRTCAKCSFAFESQSQYRSHVSQRRCEKAQSSSDLATKARLARYARALNGQGGSTCAACRYDAKSPRELILHLRNGLSCGMNRVREANGGSYVCPGCETVSDGALPHLAFSAHLLRKCSQRGLEKVRGTEHSCKSCEAVYWSEELLAKHMQTEGTGCFLTMQGVFRSSVLGQPGKEASKARPSQARTGFAAQVRRCHGAACAFRGSSDAVLAHQVECKGWLARLHKEELFPSSGQCPDCDYPSAGAPVLRVLRHFYSAKACAVFAAARRVAEEGASNCPKCARDVTQEGEEKLQWDLPLCFARHFGKSNECRRELVKTPPSADFECGECETTLSSGAKLEAHELSRYGCRVIESRVLEDMRPNPVAPQPNVLCDECGESLPQDKLRRHSCVRRALGLPLLVRHRCPACRFVAPDEAGLSEHLASCQAGKLKQHQEELLAASGSVCPDCGFNRPGFYVGHFYSARRCLLQKAAQELVAAGKLACPDCGFLGNDENQGHHRTPVGHLVQHWRGSGCMWQRLKDAKAAELQCDGCPAVLSSAAKLAIHKASRFGCELAKSGAVDWRAEKSGLDRGLGQPGRRQSGTTDTRRCSGCGLKTEDAESLAAHQETCEGGKLSAHKRELLDALDGSCPDCGYSEIRFFARHIYSAAKCRMHKAASEAVVDDVGKCPSCPFTTSAESTGTATGQMVNHLRGAPACLRLQPSAKAAEASFACAECSVSLPSERKLVAHQESRLGCQLVQAGAFAEKAPEPPKQRSGKPKCQACGHKAANEEDLREHFASCEGGKVRQHGAELLDACGGACPDCGYQRLGSFVGHFYSVAKCRIQKVANEAAASESASCPSCDFEPSDDAARSKEGQLVVHLRTKPNCLRKLASPDLVEKLTCDTCPATFESEAKMAAHKSSKLGCELVKAGLLDKPVEPTAQAYPRYSNRLKCFSCDFRTREEDELSAHLATCPEGQVKAHHAELWQASGGACPDCGYSRFGYFDGHFYSAAKCRRSALVARLVGEGKSACPDCGFEAAAPDEEGRGHSVTAQLYHHLSIKACCREELRAQAPVTYRCTACQAPFESRRKLTLHSESKYGCAVFRTGLFGKVRKDHSMDKPVSQSYQRGAGSRTHCVGKPTCAYKSGDSSELAAHEAQCSAAAALRHKAELFAGLDACRECGYQIARVGARPLAHFYSPTDCRMYQAARELAGADGTSGCPECDFEVDAEGRSDLSQMVHHWRLRPSCRHAVLATRKAELFSCPTCQVSLNGSWKIEAHKNSKHGCRLVQSGAIRLGKSADESTSEDSAPQPRRSRKIPVAPQASSPAISCQGCQESFTSAAELQDHQSSCPPLLFRRHKAELFGDSAQCGECGYDVTRQGARPLPHFYSSLNCRLYKAAKVLVTEGRPCPSCAFEAPPEATLAESQFTKHWRIKRACQEEALALAEGEEASCEDCDATLNGAWKMAAHRASELGCRLVSSGLLRESEYRPRKRKAQAHDETLQVDEVGPKEEAMDESVMVEPTPQAPKRKPAPFKTPAKPKAQEPAKPKAQPKASEPAEEVHVCSGCGAGFTSTALAKHTCPKLDEKENVCQRLVHALFTDGKRCQLCDLVAPSKATPLQKLKHLGSERCVVKAVVNALFAGGAESVACGGCGGASRQTADLAKHVASSPPCTAWALGPAGVSTGVLGASSFGCSSCAFASRSPRAFALHAAHADACAAQQWVG